MKFWWGDEEEDDGIDRTMNLVDEICDMLGIRVNEPFQAMGNDKAFYRINKKGLSEHNPDGDNKQWFPSSMVLIQILEGLMEVDWTPDIGEKYYYPTKEEIESAIWGDTAFDRKNKELTGLYKSRDRAEKKQRKIWKIRRRFYD